MFDDRFYLQHVNREFGWSIRLTSLTDELPRNPARHALNPLDCKNGCLGRSSLANELRFNHYRPARYLCEHLESLAVQLSDGTLECLEQTFVKLNELHCIETVPRSVASPLHVACETYS